MPSPVHFRETPRIELRTRRSPWVAWLTALAIFAGGLLSAGIVVLAVRFASMEPQKVTRGQIALACGSAVTAAGVTDTGGCRCAARAATKDSILNSRRRVELLRFYDLAADNPEILGGRAPTATSISRNIGLIYGHPFVRAYRTCYRGGFIDADGR